ncbi:ceramidase [Diaporthe sp. PMI_573]|nr:ceramidase [Diaporthaceae sp. PMI_573]
MPYPASEDGFWSPVTATINWCEEDCYVSVYVAEFVNAFSNAIFGYLALVGISSCIRNKHPAVFLVAYISYMIIGLASFIYHASLKYWMQLFDELSMIYTTCILFFAVFSHGKTTLGQALLAIFIIGLAVFISVYYHYLGDPVFHQVMFAMLTATVVLRSIYVMLKTLWPQSRPQNNLERRDIEIIGAMWTMIATGLSSIAVGFLAWNLDNILCSHLRHWRRELVACYFNITYGLWLRYCRDGKKHEVDLVWPSFFGSVPTVEQRIEAVTKPVPRTK